MKTDLHAVKARASPPKREDALGGEAEGVGEQETTDNPNWAAAAAATRASDERKATPIPTAVPATVELVKMADVSRQTQIGAT
jgi:hypothetical protein